MNDILENLTIDGYAVEIYPDRDVENPHAWCSSTLCIAHRRHNFGGERLSSDANSIEEAFAWHLAEQGMHERDIICLPVYIYEHGGIALKSSSFGDRWDSGQLGFLYETRADIRREFKVKRISPKLEGRIRERLRGEIAELSAWANGDTYRFAIPALDMGCGGFYGDDHQASGLIEQARENIRYAAQQQRHRHFSSLKKMIRSRVPLQYRPALAFQS